MNESPRPTHCPACRAPYPEAAITEYYATCEYCGEELILKVRHEDILEQKAFDHVEDMTSPRLLLLCSPVMLLIGLYFYCGGQLCLEHGHTGWGYFLMGYAACMVLVIPSSLHSLAKRNRKEKGYRKQCKESIEQLETMAKGKKDRTLARYLRLVKREYETIRKTLSR